MRYSENGMTKMTTDPRIEAIAKAFIDACNTQSRLTEDNEWRVSHPGMLTISTAFQTLLDDGVIALPDLDGGFYDLATLSRTYCMALREHGWSWVST